MSEQKWTKEQLEAISEDNCNMLVAAAAGAGKTAVLVERIIRKVTDGENPIDIDKLLVVTFTNAAATEMRERIGDAIVNALDRNPASKRLQRQLSLLNRASITTMHSFCLEVIKNNFHCIDLDPGFRIADQTEAVLLKMEALDELFEDRYTEEGLKDEFLQLVECYGGNRDDEKLKDMVLALYEFVQSHPWPHKWLHEKTECFNLSDDADFGITDWAQMLVKGIIFELSGLTGMLGRAVNIIRKTEGLEPYLLFIKEEMLKVEALLDAAGSGFTAILSWDVLYNAFRELDFDRLPRCGKDVDRARQEQVKEIRGEVKDRLKKIKEEIFSGDSVMIMSDLKKLYPLIKCYSQLVKEFGERYAAKKRGKSVLDFGDLEHFCLDILIHTDESGTVRPTESALGYRERFEEILVDEYQDSNLVQEVIVNSISRMETEKPNIFMVGDVKQSIYRFRQARPELFLEKYSSFTASGGRDRRILLYKNFRSREEVVSSVNFIFGQIMSQNVGELDYSGDEALNPGAVYEPPTEKNTAAGWNTELHIIETSGNAEITEQSDYPADDPDDENSDMGTFELEQLDNIQLEARMVAKRIKELIEPEGGGRAFKTYEKASRSYRNAQFRDVVILLRSTRDWAQIFLEELGNQGIPAYADTGAGYFKTIEVQIMLSLLQIIDNPMQDIPMLSVLRSPVASFSTGELIDIRLMYKEASFYEAMKKMAEEGSGNTAERTGAFLENLNKWRDKALHMSTDELIWYLYTNTGYYSYAGAMPGGVKRQANLRILFERARQYEETSYKGLFNFINFINKLKSSGGDMGSAKILGENENVVRIMSIHKSKGLEFPVVIVSGCGKKFNMQDMNKSMLLHQELGFGPDFVDCKRRISYPAMPKQALRYKIKLETLSEEMRILYVAFTRAKEKLIITGSTKDVTGSAAKWGNSVDIGNPKLPDYYMLRATNYLDWIGAAVIRHRDCGGLRQLAGIDEDGACFLDDKSKWELKLWERKDLHTVRVEGEDVKQDFLRELGEPGTDVTKGEYEAAVRGRLVWEYPYGMAVRLPTKISVTELKRFFNAEFPEEYEGVPVYMPLLVKKPAFLDKVKGLNAMEKGNALHFVMQHLNYDKIHKSFIENNMQELSTLYSDALHKEITLQLDKMVLSELLNEQQAKAVDVHGICGFFCAPLGLRMLKSGKVSRETPFNIEIGSTELYKELPQDIYGAETILLQGVIDCYFEEEDGIVLLDYKTDYVPKGGENLLSEKYSMQIEHYARALERITGRVVKEKYIYLFWNETIIKY